MSYDVADMKKKRVETGPATKTKIGSRKRVPSVRKTVFENGLTVLSESMAHTESVSFGIYLTGGSRYERADEHGMSHFIEHALFKGTGRRTAARIASEADSLGGNFNAFTARDVVGYTNHVLVEHLPEAFDLAADILTDPAFDEAELDKERNVIIEEIKMTEDDPSDIIYDIFYGNFYPGSALGRSILGTPETLAGFTSAGVRRYFEESYLPERLYISAAGRLDHDHLVELASRYFGGLNRGGGMAETDCPVPATPVTLISRPELEQSHILLGFPCPSAVSEDRYAVNLLGQILGGGMSSRLFQSIREERGLVYAIDADINDFLDCGFLSIYAGASTEQLNETIGAIMAEVERIRTETVGEEELRRNKVQLKTAFRLDQESSSSRMGRLAGDEIYFGRYFSPEEVVARFDAVSGEDLRRVAEDIFRPERLALTVLGNLEGFTLDRTLLH